ncbi:TolC family protein [Sphingomonas koreensis]|jgi:outer membrane protein, heavy metal efflux system|uniref:TolC family protein n=1 Tax=Sphingomonas koreensis TaxID=93064 RepID=A0A2M8WAP2_9SPHN|nr:TolC family protein [Sphingomonas koreensis]PJI87952.1 cobalt-zinc-cadmium efflux system outer membrane protein [Sphingomonas koreensis]RSU56416.1 TolC family protein [Sphingomonas koreensis]RSU66125.1 TolC family protein [Sphingomonas koreensis]RSY78527.1 TolC family protein [Sphingomonas koreensis]
MYSPFRAALVVAVCLPSAALAQAQPLTVEDAIRRTLAAAPQTASTAARIEAQTAARTAAGLRPQPSIDVQVENFGIPTGNLYDQFQITGMYSQRIERGGKREARVALADREMDVTRAEAIVTRLDVIAQVQRLYVEVQATEAQIGIAKQRLTLARMVEAEVKRRVASAKDPLFAGMRATTSVSEAKVDLELATHARDAAFKRLTAMWGGTPADLSVPAADFLRFKEEPVGPSAPSPADLAVYTARGARADATVNLQTANAKRDPTLSAGPRFIGTGDVALVAGVSLPLGGRRLSDARIAEAQAERRRVDADLAVERFTRERAIALLVEKVEETAHEAEAIRDQVIPNADLTLMEVRVGYNRGFFSYTDVSAAQTTLANARARMVDAVRRHHEARVELDRLTGRFTELAQGDF